MLVSPTITLYRLHRIIQEAMGWSDSHLHLFDADGVQYGLPEDENMDYEIVDETKVPLKRVLFQVGASIHYVYDYGDNWRHKITLEKVLPLDPSLKYPLAIAGKRACPPEDCGGIWGYESILDALRGGDEVDDEDKEDRDALLEWVGSDFNPELFDLEQINARLSGA